MDNTILMVTLIIALVLVIYRIMDFIELLILCDVKAKRAKAILKNRKNLLKQVMKGINKF